MNEKFGSYNQIVSPIIPEESKQELLDMIKLHFENGGIALPDGYEKEKTHEDLFIIDLANKATNLVRAEFQLENFDVPANNIKIMRSEKWSPHVGEGVNGMFNPEYQAVLLKERESKLELLHDIIHELFHFKAFQSLHLDKGGEGVEDRRSGLRVVDSTGGYLLSDLDEALTEELTKRAIQCLMQEEIFTAENRAYKELADAHYQIDVDGRLWDAAEEVFSVSFKPDGGLDLNGMYAYREQRAALNSLVDKLFAANQEAFSTREEIFKLFVRGQVEGNILPLTRLIETTFGKGTMRMLGEQHGEKLENFVEQLTPIK